MANIHTVFEAVMETAATGEKGKKIKVGVADKHEYETVRTRLVKLWNTHKELLTAIAGEDCDPLLVFSLCANYCTDVDSGENFGVFYLGMPRRKLAKNYSFAVVESPETAATVQTSILPDAVNDSANSATILASIS